MKKALVLFAFAAFVLVLVLRPGGGRGPVSSDAHGSYMEDVRVVNREEGRLLWSLRSQRTAISDEGDAAKLQRVTVSLPSHDMTVTADTGVYDIIGSGLELEGNIEADAVDYTIITGHVTLDSESGEVWTDERVLIEGRRFKIVGKGLRALNREVRLLGDVRAEFF
jgi:LPS export ABC transporter protein LptC